MTVVEVAQREVVVERYGVALLDTFASNIECFFNDKRKENLLKNILEAVEVILSVGHGDLESTKPKILDALERLQTHNDTDLHNYAKDLLRDFFGAEDNNLEFID